jgi:putative membrane protein
MKELLMATAFLMFAGPAAVQSVRGKTGLNSLIGVNSSTTDFVKEVAISDMFEIACESTIP